MLREIKKLLHILYIPHDLHGWKKKTWSIKILHHVTERRVACERPGGKGGGEGLEYIIGVGLLQYCNTENVKKFGKKIIGKNSVHMEY